MDEKKMKESKEVKLFWQEFCEINGVTLETKYLVWSFGNTSEMADELLQLVLEGKKRATTGLVWDYENDSEPLPTLDDFNIITDGVGAPRAILQSTEVRVLPFNKVGASFAFEEGEGDQSLDYWRQAHWKFFSEVCLEIGKQPALDMPVCCIRFELVYPNPD